MSVYKLTTPRQIRDAAEIAHKKAGSESDQSSYNAAWLHGYAAALGDVAKQIYPIKTESAMYIVATANNFDYDIRISQIMPYDEATKCLVEKFQQEQADANYVDGSMTEQSYIARFHHEDLTYGSILKVELPTGGMISCEEAASDGN